MLHEKLSRHKMSPPPTMKKEWFMQRKKTPRTITTLKHYSRIIQNWITLWASLNISFLKSNSTNTLESHYYILNVISEVPFISFQNLKIFIFWVMEIDACGESVSLNWSTLGMKKPQKFVCFYFLKAPPKYKTLQNINLLNLFSWLGDSGLDEGNPTNKLFTKQSLSLSTLAW